MLEDLKELAAGLLALHRALLERQRLDYEALHGPIAGGAELLHLALHDASFDWLRILSALMVDLDTLLDDDELPSQDEARAIRQELEELFSSAAPRQFWDSCLPLLQTPSVTMAYGRVRAVLARLPRTAPADIAAELHAKHRWAVARRMRGAA